jgi:endonuclease YncB( thermonuclease family)
MKWIIAALVSTFFLGAVAVKCKGADARNIKITDGDTFVCDISLGFGVVLPRKKIRVYNYDSWETGSRSGIKYHPNEKELGLKAKKAFEDLLNQAQVVELVEKGTSFDRLVCKVLVDGEDVGPILRKQGHERWEE